MKDSSQSSDPNKNSHPETNYRGPHSHMMRMDFKPEDDRFLIPAPYGNGNRLLEENRITF
ncbi:unnamed protein product [Dovyalis caffra]|uniref:Uncharacterized protein n=1 Tax=Dovyalis caffra TaxID=77055 RepID=A0AAV1RQ72_9ROSI|nr:unnamed protein product [Dovyalis caffra]